MSQCEAITSQGKRCKREALDNGYCFVPAHQKMAGTETNELPTLKSETKPWSTEDNPWVKDNMRLKGKHVGFRPRWIAATEVEKRHPWQVADKRNYGYKVETGEDTVLRRNELVLCEITEQLAKQREEYQKSKSMSAMQEARRIQLSAAEKKESMMKEKFENR